MADEDDAKNQAQEQQEDSKAESGDKKASGGRLQWIIMAVVVIVGAGAGFGLGRLLGDSGTNETAQSTEGGNFSGVGPVVDDADEKEHSPGYHTVGKHLEQTA